MNGMRQTGESAFQQAEATYKNGANSSLSRNCSTFEITHIKRESFNRKHLNIPQKINRAYSCISDMRNGWELGPEQSCLSH